MHGGAFLRPCDRKSRNLCQNAKDLHIDIDAAEINKNIPAYASVVGDMKAVLTDLLPMLEKKEHKEWMAHIKELKEKYPLKYHEDVLSCPYIMEEIYKVTEGEGDHYYGCGAASDVGGTVLSLYEAQNLPVLRWSRYNGLRTGSLHRRQDGQTG